MSNPYTQEILAAVSTRITRERIIVAHDWIHDRLREYGSEGIGAEALSAIGSPAERGWFASPTTILASIRRLHDQSAEAVFAMKRPSFWLVRSLFWALEDPTLLGHWLTDDIIRWEPDDPRLLAERLFGGASTSLDILTATLNAQDPVADRMTLLAGHQWSLAVLSVLTPTLLAYLDHPERLADQPMPRDLAVTVLADLRSDLLGSTRMEAFREIARRRQERGRDEQETAGEEE